MNLTGPIQVTPKQTFDVVAATDTNPIAVGTIGFGDDGRRYRWAQAGAVDLVVGNVLQAAAQITNHQTLAVTATAIGATVVNVTPGATAGAANLYAGGELVVSVTPGLGFSYGISSHPAIVASTAFNVTLRSDDKIQVALTTSSKVTLVANPYAGVIQSPVTTLTGAVVGVAISVIPANGWGWIGTNGSFGTLIAGTPGVGLAVVVPATAAGAVVIDGAASATPPIGVMMVTGVDAQVMPVLWALP